MTTRDVARDLVLDGAKAFPLVGYWTAVVRGMTITDWASLAALLYTLLLIADKLRAWGWFRWLGRFLPWVKPAEDVT